MLVYSQKYNEMQRQYQTMQLESQQKIQDLKVMLVLLQSMPKSLALMTALACSHIPGICKRKQQALEKEKEISASKVIQPYYW